MSFLGIQIQPCVDRPSSHVAGLAGEHLCQLSRGVREKWKVRTPLGWLLSLGGFTPLLKLTRLSHLDSGGC